MPREYSSERRSSRCTPRSQFGSIIRNRIVLSIGAANKAQFRDNPVTWPGRHEVGVGWGARVAIPFTFYRFAIIAITALAALAPLSLGRARAVSYLVMVPRAMPGLAAGLALLWLFLFFKPLAPLRETLI